MPLRNLNAVNRAWSFIAAQTNVKLIDVGATQHLEVYYCQVIAANSNTGDVSCRLGTGASALPTLTDDSATGAVGELLSHGGIAKGGGAVVSQGGAPVLVAAQGDDLYLTCSVATGGSLRVILQYRTIDDV